MAESLHRPIMFKMPIVCEAGVQDGFEAWIKLVSKHNCI